MDSCSTPHLSACSVANNAARPCRQQPSRCATGQCTRLPLEASTARGGTAGCTVLTLSRLAAVRITGEVVLAAGQAVAAKRIGNAHVSFANLLMIFEMSVPNVTTRAGSTNRWRGPEDDGNAISAPGHPSKLDREHCISFRNWVSIITKDVYTRFLFFLHAPAGPRSINDKRARASRTIPRAPGLEHTSACPACPDDVRHVARDACQTGCCHAKPPITHEHVRSQLKQGTACHPLQHLARPRAPAPQRDVYCTWGFGENAFPPPPRARSPSAHQLLQRRAF